MDLTQQETILKSFEFHANWNLTDSPKSFMSLKQSIEEQREDGQFFTIEILLFESYLYMAEFKGISEKDPDTAKEKNEEALQSINGLNNGPIKDGYEYIYLALRCWISHQLGEIDTDGINKLKSISQKYKNEQKQQFRASICITKGIALSKLSSCRYAESEKELCAATDACPENDEWLFMLGLIKWRRHKQTLMPFESSLDLHNDKFIMEKVLEINPNHAYGKIIIADIYRREYHSTHNVFNGKHDLVFKSVEDPCVSLILDLLNKANAEASRAKLSSLVAQCYIRLGDCLCKGSKTRRICSKPGQNSKYFECARNVIEDAKTKFGEASCIFVQEAILHREENNINKQIECLKRAIELKDSDVGARLQLVTALSSIGNHDAAEKKLRTLAANFKDPFQSFDINYRFALYLDKRKEIDKAIDKNKICLDIALKSFVNTKKDHLEFIEERRGQIIRVITYLETKLKKKKKGGITPFLELAVMHKNLQDFETAISDYEGALRLCDHDDDKKKEIIYNIAYANLKWCKFDKCRESMEKLKSLLVEDDVSLLKKINFLEMELLVAEGQEASQSGRHNDAIKKFESAVEICVRLKTPNLDAVKALINEMKDEDKSTSCFLKRCALVKKLNAVMSNKKVEEDLEELLSCCDDSIIGKQLHEIRKCLFDMEYAKLMGEIDDALSEASSVIQKGRNKLNYAMQSFNNKHYPQEKSSDFPIIYMQSTKTKLVDKMLLHVIDGKEKKDFRNRFKSLLIFLVKIQPVHNPKFKWLEDVCKLNNQDKHECSLEDGLLSTGKNHEDLFNVARDLGSNIEEILDKMFEWIWFTPRK